MDKNREKRKQNAERWGHIQQGHIRDWYDLDGFRRGGCSLRSIERDALGDVAGRRILHLQCNCGLDSLSLARLGAKVTGVDLSAKNIAVARELSAEVGVSARFVCADVLELDDELPEAFDIVFASYGVFCWIDDLGRWMRMASNHLVPGGLFYYVDGHPARWPYDESGKVSYSYFHASEPLVSQPESEDDLTSYEWQWTVADIVNAAIGAELVVEHLGEYPVAAYRWRKDLVKGGDGWWRSPGIDFMPQTLSLRARKPA